MGDQLKLNFEGARTFPAETKSARPSSPAQIPFAVLVVYMHLEERPAPSPKKTTCRTVDDPTAALCLLLKTEIAGPTGRRLTVFELLLNAARMAADSTTIDNKIADAILRQHGLAVSFDEPELHSANLLIANNVPAIWKMFALTPYARDFRKQLSNLPGARKHPKLVSFRGIKSRCIAIKLTEILSISRDEFQTNGNFAP